MNASSRLILLSVILFIEAKFGICGWVDPDSADEIRTRRSFTDGKLYDLVMSDEFNREGRKFKDGYDPMWTGIDKSDDDQTSNGRKSLQFYNASMITTKNGKLVISTTTEDTKWKGWNPYKKKYEQMVRHFKSGMLQSWNKFCYTGGIFEVSVKFPGRHDVGGLWPAVWLLGNLGRATFESSTNLMWPWSYNKCDRALQMAQEVSGCDITSHFSMEPGKGRGATEIDIIEVMPGPSGKLPIVKNNVQRPYTSMTLQVAPGVPAAKKRPPVGTLPEWGFHWYPNLTYGTNTTINPFFYGTFLAATKTEEPIARSAGEEYQADAISSMFTLNESYWSKFHTFRCEWQPGPKGYLHWYVDNVFKFGIEEESLKIMDTHIPQEPSYIIFNTAISTSWGFPNPPWGCTEYDCKTTSGRCGFNPGFCQSLPAEYQIDWVRVYQDKSNTYQTVGCNPKDFPTRKWILAHEYRYKSDDDYHALKAVPTGGETCAKDTECGTGYCFLMRCRCNKGWTGPDCMSPDYHDDGEDWEKESWLGVSSPYLDTFLGFAVIVLLGLLGSAAYSTVKQKRNDMNGVEKVPEWL